MTNHTGAPIFSPGEFLKEELDARGWTQSDFAAVLGRPLQAVNEIINGRRGITSDTAKAIGKALGTSAELWMNLDTAYQLAMSGPTDDIIAMRAELYAYAPVSDILKRRWVDATPSDFSDLRQKILAFMGTERADTKPAFRAAARKSTSYADNHPAEVAWLRRAEELAAGVQVQRFRKSLFHDRVVDLRDLAASDADVRRIPRALAEIGVRLVVVEPLPKMRMDGAVFWLDSTSPVIALSLRFDRIDSMWYTLAHELGHIVHGDGRMFCDINLVGDAAQKYEDKSEEEKLADDFASELLVPKTEIESFIARVSPLYSRKRIIGFANRIGVHPGIVVGQLQFRGEIAYSHSRPLLVKVRSQLAENAMTDGWGHDPGAIQG